MNVPVREQHNKIGGINFEVMLVHSSVIRNFILCFIVMFNKEYQVTLMSHTFLAHFFPVMTFWKHSDVFVSKRMNIQSHEYGKRGKSKN